MRLDWDMIREEYIHGSGSQRMLAQKYGVNVRTLSRRAVKEDWYGQKREWMMAMHTVHLGCPEEAFWLEGVRDAANTLTDTVNRALQNPEQVYQGKDGKSQDKHENRADVSEVQKWAAIIRELSAIMRSLYDLPGFTDREQIRLQERKLELEEKKMRPETGSDTDGRVFLPQDAFSGEDA